jgi:hypothetical protein
MRALLELLRETEWHVPQTLATEETAGGVAPWLPWQELHVGAERSPFSNIAFAWTLCMYFA